MADDGTKSINAKLSVKPEKEMKTDVKKWVFAEKDVKKIFSKPIVFQEKVDLNPKRWNEGKLSKAMEGLVRAEMQLLAQRVGDIKKKSGDAKSPKEHKAMLSSLEAALDDVTDKIQDKCSEALEELASGKAEAKAGIALGKKAMAKLKTLSVDKMFTNHGQTGLDHLKKWASATKAGADDAAISKLNKDGLKAIEDAAKDVKSTGKDAQNVAKFLLDTGKKLKGHENGKLAKFGERIMKKELHPQLQKLDVDMDKLEKALDDFASDLKSDNLDAKNAGAYMSEFKAVQSLQKSASNAMQAMKDLESSFKAIEKDLK